ncbi:MAG TPA: retropepsin-like aspartic protease [Pyrinomonadaceae bacterium]|nr:retropepsin-like aspartic protease [Pyrinomonadaceae bacterium]
MKFKYRYVADKYKSTKLVRMPFLPFRLAYGEKMVPLLGLIDTGAADCLFDRAVVDDLGIDLTKTHQEKEYFGIAGQTVIGYMHSIEFQILGFAEWIEIEAGFLDTKLPYPLLGQSGFFDNYDVILKLYRGRFEVKSRSYLH